MDGPKSNARWLLPLSFLITFVLMVYPLPMEWRWLRPELVALLAVYWVLTYPLQLGVGMAFIVGLLQDLIQGSVLGQHALALVVAVYLCQLSAQRLRTYGMVQQMMWVFALILLHEAFLYWVSLLAGREAKMAYFWVPALLSALLWPVLRSGLDRLRWYWRMS